MTTPIRLAGNYSYLIRFDGEVVAFEDSRVDTASIVASRRSADGLNRHRVEAALDNEYRICRTR